MDKTPNKRKFYTFMIVPHDARGRPVSIKVPARWVYTAAFAALFAIFFVGSSFVYTTLLSRRLVNYVELLSKNSQQKEIISSFSDKTNRVGQAIDELAQQDNELRKMLGLKGWESKLKLSTDQIKPKSDKISLDLDLIDARIAERKKSFDELKNWVNVVRSRVASTPSTWPVYGRIASLFGYRVAPWRGVHTGIDIDARYGTPARATAPGVVTFVGWRTGYGKVVEINHGYGVSTLYAHNSGFAVRVGQKVGRGQIVSFVGMTGWTTGPHLHYEVRKWDHPINPIAFLDLNIFSASRLLTN